MSLPNGSLASENIGCYKADMSTEAHDHSAISAAEDLIREGERIRAKLLEEREALVERLRHIDRVVAALPRGSDSKGDPVPSPDARGEKMPEMVKAIIASNPAGVSAADVLATVRQLRPGADARLVHSALYRLSLSKRIKKSGRRGASVYFPVEGKRGFRSERIEHPPRTGAPGEALQKTARLIAEQHDAVNSARLAELMDITQDAARVRLRRAKQWGLVKPGPVAGTFVAANEGGAGN